MDQLLAMRVFVRIAESGAFSRAADSMDVPRATVTKLVQDLERHLGVKLLQRTTRRVNVTPEGAAYFERAVKVIAELEDLDESVGRAATQPRGRLRVDIGSSLANMLMIPALPRFRERYPQLHVDLGVNDRPVDLIGEGIDCVIRGGNMLDTTLVARRLADLEWVTCAAPSYLRQRGPIDHPGELLGAGEEGKHLLVGYFSSLTGRHVSMEFYRQTEQLIVPVNASIAVNESTAHLTSLLAGLGVGQTFRFMVERHIAEGNLAQVLPEWTRPHHRIQLVYPSTRHLHTKVRAFADWAASIFAQVDALKIPAG